MSRAMASRPSTSSNPDSDYDLPQDVIDRTIEKYKEAYHLLTGEEL